MFSLSLPPKLNHLIITAARTTTTTFSAADLCRHNPCLFLHLNYRKQVISQSFPINPTLKCYPHVNCKSLDPRRTFYDVNHHDDGSGDCGGSGGSNNFFNSDSWWRWWPDDDGGGDSTNTPFLFYSLVSRFSTNINGEQLSSILDKTLLFFLALHFLSHHGFISPAKAESTISTAKDGESSGGEEKEIVYEVKGGNRIELVPDYSRDVFVVQQRLLLSWSSLLVSGIRFPDLWRHCKDICVRLMLPAGFPESVTSDYLEYSLWRGIQGVAAQISGVLATQSLLYAVGLGKGAIPTAAALNWVLKDGIGYLGKIFLSKFGRHFDVHPKGWRLFADLLENAAYGLEILTPAFPHLFVPIGAAAGAGRSAAALIQASTRSCFYAGFAAQRNFAEVIAKGEAQGMVSKSIGITIGIALANCISSSTPLVLASFGAITWVHMFCNLKSYQSIQLRTLNPYRASLVFSEYLLSGLVPSVNEVNDEEPLFPAVPFFNIKPAYNVQLGELSKEAKDAAANIVHRLQLGSKLSDILTCKDDAVALFDLYQDEGYILTEHEGRFCVILKESSVPQDMLKSLFHVSYLYWLEENAGIKSQKSISDDCRQGGRLQISFDYVQREFNHVKNDGELAGWVTDGLIARPLPNRIRPGYLPSAGV